MWQGDESFPEEMSGESIGKGTALVAVETLGLGESSHREKPRLGIKRGCGDTWILEMPGLWHNYQE